MADEDKKTTKKASSIPAKEQLDLMTLHDVAATAREQGLEVDDKNKAEIIDMLEGER
jgi:hypothetical protein